MLTRRLASVLVMILAVTAGLAVPAAPAAAQECGFRFVPGPNGGEVVVWTCADGGGPGGGGGEWTCHTSVQGTPMQVPCFHDTFGWFTTTVHGGCYISPMSPQPPAGDEDWEGNDPSDGVVYNAWCYGFEGLDGLPFIHLPTTIFLDALIGPIGDLIERAIGLLPLRGADIHTAPSSEGVGLVGLPVWMWTPETTSTWGPATDSLTALGVTIQVEANAESIRWDMGDGTEVTCEAPGTPYGPESGADPSPDCPHVYEEPSRGQPDGRYQLTATTQWRIDWQIAQTTVSGVELRTRTSSTSVRINELQVVTS